MTTEEKARAYDEALEKAKRTLTIKELYYLFPEFKEIESEQIKKDLIDYLEKKVDENISTGLITPSNMKEYSRLSCWIYWLKNL